MKVVVIEKHLKVLNKNCRKLGHSLWDYLDDRLSNRRQILNLELMLVNKIRIIPELTLVPYKKFWKGFNRLTDMFGDDILNEVNPRQLETTTFRSGNNK